jgi:hypothetical protein
MSNFYGKQRASGIIKAQNLSYAGSGVVVSTGFTSQTYQVRIVSTVAGNIAIDVTGSSSTQVSTSGGTGSLISANAVGEYFSVSPSEILTFSSTGGTAGVLSVSEVA